MGNGKRRENRAGILVSVSVEENEVVVDNLDAARSHTYLSATCVHGECTDDPYAWCNDGTARIARWPLAKGPRERSNSARCGWPLFFFRWPISRLECKETAKEKGEEKGRWQGCGPGEPTPILMIVLKTYLRQNYS